MEKYHSKTIQIPVINQDGEPLGIIKKILINFDKGKVIGFIIGRNKIISPIDIMTWEDYIKINNKDDIVSETEIIEVKTYIKDKRKIIGSKVITEKGKLLGKVIDYTINSNFYSLEKLIVKKTFLKFIKFNKQIIPANEIIEIKKNKIIVKEDTKDIKVGIMQTVAN